MPIPLTDPVSSLQRWLSRDPLGQRGGINLYRFVGNTPVNDDDPFGLTNLPGDFGWGNYSVPAYTLYWPWPGSFEVSGSPIQYPIYDAPPIINGPGNELWAQTPGYHRLMKPRCPHFESFNAIVPPSLWGTEAGDQLSLFQTQQAVDTMAGFFIGELIWPAGMATEINPNKFDYLFGNVTSDAHNTARSLQNAAQLNRIGIQNTPEGVQILTEHLNSAVQESENIINTFSKTLPDSSVINLQTRGSLLSGPGGFLKLESTWQVMPDGALRFTTAIPIGGH